MWRKTGLACCILGLAVVAGTARNVAGGMIDIDTTVGWNQGTEDRFTPFGYGDSLAETVGQTFTVTDNAILNGFTFWVDTGGIGMSVTASAFVYGWDGASATDLHYSSNPEIISNTTSLESIDFSTGGVSLLAGEYVAFLSASATTELAVPTVGARGSDVYLGGAGFFLNGTDWTSSSWTPTSGLAAGIPDLAFRADFSDPPSPVVPEPSSLALLGLGCACMAFVRARRARSSAKS